MDFLKSSGYPGIRFVLERESAQIIEESEDGIFLYDRESKVFMIAGENVNVEKAWMVIHEGEYSYQLVRFYDEELRSFLSGRYGLKEGITCYQAVSSEEAGAYHSGYKGIPGIPGKAHR